MKIVFLGTSELSLPALEMLISGPHDLVAAITRPDRPAGRGKKLAAPAVKLCAREKGVPVFQPADLSEPSFLSELYAAAPDLLVAAAFGGYVPRKVLALPPRGAINLHPSLLPRYRGAAPVAWALINGERETGVSVHYLVEKVDAGDILGSRRVPITPEDDRVTLRERLFAQGAQLLAEVVGEIAAGRQNPHPQDPAGVIRAPRLRREDGLLDWNDPAVGLVNRIRGLQPWPGAVVRLPTEFGLRPIKILRARPDPRRIGRPGEVLEAAENLVIAAGEGGVCLERVQAPGKAPLDSASFLRGCRVILSRIVQ